MRRLVSALDIHFPAVHAEPDLPDRVAVAIDELGVVAVHEFGPDDAPTWRLFLDNPSRLDAARQQLEAEFSKNGCSLEVIAIEDDDWAARTQAHLSHVVVGRVIVAPPWDVPKEIAPDAHLVVIPPSMGFGTGHHETTRLCLELLQMSMLGGKRVLDVGTGSGVLAIAAHLLGASDVEGIDYDEDALIAARQSLGINGLSGRIVLRAADVRVGDLRPADVVTANLTGALLVAQAARLASLVSDGGLLIVSGFQRSESDAVLEAFAPFVSSADCDRLCEGEWEAARLLRLPTSR